MNQNKNERLLINIISLFGLTLVAENIIRGWEFWVPPLVISGIVVLWIMFLYEWPYYSIRSVMYFIFSLVAAFIMGAHKDSSIDTAMAVSLLFVVFSFLNHAYMLNMLFIEYFIIVGMELFISYEMVGGISKRNVLEMALQTLIVWLFYASCLRIVNDRTESQREMSEKDERIEAVDADMEDFLSNISHELRTPVNVVNGMSEMLIKKRAGKEAMIIKNAGIRLSNHIEDIQDYTECKRNHIILEEEEYISTSLIHDVVTSFRMYENDKGLELIVDMDPNVPYKLRGDVKKLHKIFRHLLGNAVKFSKKGGIYVNMHADKTDYGVNLCIEMTDTGIGMDRKEIASVARGMFQANKKRNRSAGGIGLGLFIVYGFAHCMGGFVRIEAEKKVGTTVRVTIPQKVLDSTPGLQLDKDFRGDIIFHVSSDKFNVPRIRDFYRTMALNLARKLDVPLYSAETVKDIEKYRDKLNLTHIFMGQEEYEKNPDFYDELSREGIVVAVSAESMFTPPRTSRVLVVPKPIYAYPIVKVLNEGADVTDIDSAAGRERPVFSGVRALVVDDEPMNLVVATDLFEDYEMIIETADSGRDSISKFENNEYDVVFMDHMMPEMDGVEAMKNIRKIAAELGRNTVIIALTANVVSGAKEMFMAEGFDGFISKPINTADFERVMLRVLHSSARV